MKALNPAQISPSERITELAEILARGLIRLRAAKSSPLSADDGESSLDFPPDQSGHAPVTECTETAG
jgi:hypothetical protein